MRGETLPVKILFVIPNLGYSGAAKQLSLLVPALPRDQFESRVCALGQDGHFGNVLRQAGIAVDVLGWRRWVELAALHRFRRLLGEFQPDVVHGWQPAALHLLNPLSGWSATRLVVSAPLAPTTWRRVPRLDRWLLRRAGRVIAFTKAEADHCRQIGVQESRLIQAAPAVAGAQTPTMTGARTSKNQIVCVGPLEPHKGFVDAIWTIDILRFVEDAIELLLIGTGSEAQRLQRFLGITRTQDMVRLLGPLPDVAPTLAQASIVWVPSRSPAGINVALEAMALGRPVIATRVPGLAEIVVDGATGFLIAPGGKVELARRTRQLLHDAELRQRFGEAGRRRVAEHFSVAALVKQLLPVYQAHAIRNRL